MLIDPSMLRLTVDGTETKLCVFYLHFYDENRSKNMGRADKNISDFIKAFDM